MDIKNEIKAVMLFTLFNAAFVFSWMSVLFSLGINFSFGKTFWIVTGIFVSYVLFLFLFVTVAYKVFPELIITLDDEEEEDDI